MPENASVIDPTEDPWGIPPVSVSWDVTPPFTVEGIVTKWEMAQQTAFEAGKVGKPLTWDDGRPRKKVIITMQCKADETDENDDGLRSVHVKIPSALFAAIRDALREAGKKSLPDDGTHILSLTYTKDSEQTAAERKAKLNPAKEFVALLSPTADSDTSEPPI